MWMLGPTKLKSGSLPLRKKKGSPDALIPDALIPDGYFLPFGPLRSAIAIIMAVEALLRRLSQHLFSI